MMDPSHFQYKQISLLYQNFIGHVWNVRDMPSIMFHGLLPRACFLKLLYLMSLVRWQLVSTEELLCVFHGLTKPVFSSVTALNEGRLAALLEHKA